MRLQTGNIVVRGLESIQRFMINRDYTLLVDPKSSKSLIGFFVFHFAELKYESRASLETAMIEEKSTELSLNKNSVPLNCLAPKNFYQNLLLQYKSAHDNPGGQRKAVDGRRFRGIEIKKAKKSAQKKMTKKKRKKNLIYTLKKEGDAKTVSTKL